MAVRRSKGMVGVIGLGIMGGAFAKNLVAAGWRVACFDTNPARRREARRAGVEIANNAAEVAALRQRSSPAYPSRKRSPTPSVRSLPPSSSAKCWSK